MRKTIHLLAAAVICIILPAVVSAKKDLAYFWGKDAAYINGQTAESFEIAGDLLKEHPPVAGTTPCTARKAALMLIDAALHDSRLDSSEVIASFMDGRMDILLEDLKKPVEGKGRVCRLYNNGTVIKTPDVTVAWDIYRGPARFGEEKRRLITDSAAHAVAELCDIMFLSHNHPDHVDPAVVGMFLDMGKPVVAPTEIMPGEKRIIHVRDENITQKKFRTANGSELECTILPGHQDHLQNNIVIAKTPSGFTVCVTGDEWHEGDREWIYSLKGKIPSVDLLAVHCWAYKLPEFVASFAPRTAVTSHENELGHTADHREALWLSVIKSSRVTPQCAVLAWGESLNL